MRVSIRKWFLGCLGVLAVVTLTRHVLAAFLLHGAVMYMTPFSYDTKQWDGGGLVYEGVAYGDQLTSRRLHVIPKVTVFPPHLHLTIRTVEPSWTLLSSSEHVPVAMLPPAWLTVHLHVERGSVWHQGICLGYFDCVGGDRHTITATSLESTSTLHAEVFWEGELLKYTLRGDATAWPSMVDVPVQFEQLHGDLTGTLLPGVSCHGSLEAHHLTWTGPQGVSHLEHLRLTGEWSQGKVPNIACQFEGGSADYGAWACHDLQGAWDDGHVEVQGNLRIHHQEGPVSIEMMGDFRRATGSMSWCGMNPSLALDINPEAISAQFDLDPMLFSLGSVEGTGEIRLPLSDLSSLHMEAHVAATLSLPYLRSPTEVTVHVDQFQYAGMAQCETSSVEFVGGFDTRSYWGEFCADRLHAEIFNGRSGILDLQGVFDPHGVRATVKLTSDTFCWEEGVCEVAYQEGRYLWKFEEVERQIVLEGEYAHPLLSIQGASWKGVSLIAQPITWENLDTTWMMQGSIFLQPSHLQAVIPILPSKFATPLTLRGVLTPDLWTLHLDAAWFHGEVEKRGSAWRLSHGMIHGLDVEGECQEVGGTLSNIALKIRSHAMFVTLVCDRARVTDRAWDALIGVSHPALPEEVRGRYHCALKGASLHLTALLTHGTYDWGPLRCRGTHIDCFLEEGGVHGKLGLTVNDRPLEVCFEAPDRLQIIDGKESLEVRMRRGLQPQAIEGTLWGIRAQVQCHEGVWKGTCSVIDSHIIAELCKQPEWDQCANLALRGSWIPATSTIAAAVHGKQATLRGVSLDQVYAEMTYTPTHCTLRNLHIDDLRGRVVVGLCELTRDRTTQAWQFSIPTLKATHLRSSPSSPWVIRRLYLHALQGILGRPLSLQGTGSISFNQQVAHTPSWVDIPRTVLKEWGVDPSILSPVRGRAHVDIRRGQCVITALHDVMSEADRSRFVLAEEGPSYIDFQGNVCLNLRVQQQGGLRLFEPFILSVRGSWKEPHYSLAYSP